uniref:Uncharacterized protein n=1 Tax=Romanomermis culicivorax TaxID=13658 RepID=A0A915K6E9_ROMCU
MIVVTPQAALGSQMQREHDVKTKYNNHVCDRYSDVGVPKQHKDGAIGCDGADFCLNDDQELGGDLVVDEG